MFNEIIGKTITKADLYRLADYDDKPVLKLEFTDGTHCCVVATYGGYSGESEDEYPCFITRNDAITNIIKLDDA